MLAVEREGVPLRERRQGLNMKTCQTASPTATGSTLTAFNTHLTLEYPNTSSRLIRAASWQPRGHSHRYPCTNLANVNKLHRATAISTKFEQWQISGDSSPRIFMVNPSSVLALKCDSLLCEQRNRESVREALIPI